MANEFVVKNGLISPNVQLQGSTSGSVTIAAPAVAGTTSITLPSTAGTLVTTGDTGTVTNTMLAGSIANAKLVNSAVTVGSTSISLGASSTTLAGLTSVTSTSFVGALTGNASTATTLQTARTIALSGDVAGSVSFDGSANATISATIQPDSVALGTDTTGNYMVNVSAGTGVSVSHTQGEGSTATVSIGQAVGTTDNVTFNNVTVNGTLTSDDITSTNISVAGNATITGNLTVSGTTTTINSTTIAIADLNLELARNATTATQANGAGITVTGPATAATLTYSSTDDRWNLNKNLNISRVYGTATNVSNVHTAGSYLTGGTFDGSSAVTWAVDATPSNTASKVVARDASGNFSASTITAALSGNASTASSWQNARTLSYTGDATGSLSVDGSTNVSTALTLAASGVTAGTYNNVTVNSKGLVTSGSNVAYLTSYTETDTLASVTGRGATTSSQITVDSVVTTNNGNGTNIRLGDDVWIGDVNLANTFRIRGVQDAAQGYMTFGSDNTQLGRNGTGALTWGGNTVYHTGNVPGWLTAESDTLGSVTGRGASTTSLVTFAHNASADPLSAVHITGGGTHTGLYINPTASSQAHIRFGNGGTLKWQIRVPFQDSANTDLKYYSWVAADDIYTFSHTGIGYASGSWRAPVFYDSNDTAYYGDFASTSNFSKLAVGFNVGRPASLNGSNWAARIGANDVYLVMNSLNETANYASAIQSMRTSDSASFPLHLNPNGGNVTVNQNTTTGYAFGVNGISYSNTSMRAPIFYDSDNTGYYTDPASTSNLNAVTFNGQTVWNGQLYISSTNFNTLNSGYANAADGSDIWLNYRGYNDGWSYFRNFNIGNGKGTAIFWADGSTGNIGIGAGQNAGARLHVRRGTPSGVQAINSNATILVENTGDNFIQFRNSADNGTYSGLIMSDNNQGGYVVFGNAGGGGDVLRLGGYGAVYFDVGTQDSTSSVALKTTAGLIDSAQNMYAYGSMRSPIFYDSNDTSYYLDPNSVSVLNKVAVGGNFVQTVYEDVKRYSSLYSSGTQAIRHTIGRIYFTPNHWGDWSAVNIKLQEITYSQGSIEYNIWGWYGMGNGSSLNIDAVATNGWARADYRVTLGSVTSAGWQYASHDTYYQDVYLDIDYYAGVEVMIGVEQSSITTSNPGSGTGWAYVFYDSPAQANISSFDETHQLRDRYSRRTNNLIIGSGTYGNTITPIGDSNMNLSTPSGAVYFDGWPRMYGLYDLSDTSYYLDLNYSSGASLKIAGGISTPLMWVNYSTSNYNDYNEGIRLYAANNGAAVITFNSGGTGGSSYGSLLGFTDRYEQRWAGQWQERMYSGYMEAYGSYRAPLFYDSNDTGYYLNPNSGSNLNTVNANRFSVPNSALISVGDDSATYTYNDNSTRSRIYISSQYPVLTLNSTVGTGNSNHGATLQFTFNGYDSNRQWVIGGSGTGTFLDFGTGQSSIKNPHDGIAGYGGGGSAQTVMRMTTTGVGVGGSWGAYGNVGNPSYPLHVQGTGYASGDFRAPVFYDSDNTGFYINAASSSNLNTVYANFFCGNTGNAYGIYKGYDNNNHFIAIRGSVSGNTTSPTITGAHHTTFVEYAEANDGTGWFFKTAATGNYDIVSRITRSYSYFEGSARSPLFYDSDNTGYYANPAGRSNFSSLQFDNGNLYMYQGDGTALRIQTAYGWINFGAQNSSWTHVYADRAFYTNQDWYVNGNLMHHDGNASRARNNYLMYYQGFTLDANTMDHNATGFTYAVNAPTVGPIARFSTGGGYDLWLNAAYTGGNTLYFRTRNGDAGSINSWRALVSYGINYSDSLYASIYYDSNDTGRYLDPSGTSILGGLFVAATASTGRSSYGSGTANLVLYAESTYGRATIDFRSGVNYPSDGAQIYYETATNLSSGETSRLVIRTENDADDGILIRGGHIIANSTTVDGGSSNPGFQTQYNGTARLYTYSDNTSEAGSFRAPIFYDSEDTGYYVNPNAVSRFNELYIQGGVAGVSNSSSYTEAAIEVRERGFGGAQDDTWATAPRIGFHWGGRVASQIAMNSSGWINIMNNPGNGYEAFRASDIYATGNVTAYYSDERLKTKVGKIENAIESILQIETFKYINNDIAKQNGFIGDEIQVGVSAQSVERVLPEVVKHAPFDIESVDGEITSKTGEWYKTVQYERLVPLLIEAIKEQQSEIDELKALVKQLLAK